MIRILENTSDNSTVFWGKDIYELLTYLYNENKISKDTLEDAKTYLLKGREVYNYYVEQISDVSKKVPFYSYEIIYNGLIRYTSQLQSVVDTYKHGKQHNLFNNDEYTGWKKFDCDEKIKKAISDFDGVLKKLNNR